MKQRDMKHRWTRVYGEVAGFSDKPVPGPAGASFSTRAELENILGEAFATPGTPLTEERKRPAP
jgi:hypothetical protein